ncbi:MAG TPA: hypothetical protein VM661_16140 [Candidatus Sulfotelmatobacter sp.]|jgi:hypothetical protein|nr:hypothetical protein [Candidatus Sulfotelmatobacter sp.]
MRHLFRHLIADRRASASVELAMLIPMLVLLLVGSYQLYAYMRATSLTERTSITLSDMVSRRSTQAVDCALTTNGSYLGTYFDAATRMIEPLTLDGNGMVILSAVHNVNGSATVAWQRRSVYQIKGVSSAVGAEGGKAVLPGGITVQTNGDTVVVAEVFYNYVPFAGLSNDNAMLPKAQTISRASYFRARYGALDSLGTVSGCSGLPS